MQATITINADVFQNAKQLLQRTHFNDEEGHSCFRISL